jgi:methionyl-tRNA formyltransferase
VPLRIIFCGTPAFAVPTLRHLIAQPGFQIEGVITQPDRPRGRGHETSVSPVKTVALQAGIPVSQPEKIKSEAAYAYFRRVEPDVVVIIAYGQIISAALIEIPRLGWINLHGSLLPKYRGAAPIQWAIANGETHTGLTTMEVDAGLDTGPMLLQHEVGIGPDETAPELAARLAEAGAPLVVNTLERLARGEIEPTPQDNSQATLAPLLKKEDGRIDWSLPARDIYNRIRGFEPWPGTFTSFRGGSCRVWGRPVEVEQPIAEPGTVWWRGAEFQAACGETTALGLNFVQLEGHKRVTAREFANGARLAPGERFGS